MGNSSFMTKISYADRLRIQQANRGDQPEYLLKYLLNVSFSARLMHSTLNNHRRQKNLVLQATRQYLIGLTSCLETFYRDLYIALLANDPSKLAVVLADSSAKRTFDRLRGTAPGDISDYEVAADLAKFQNLRGVDKALSWLFAPATYLEALGAETFYCVIPSRRPGMAEFKLHIGWQDTLSQLFETRHRFVHDASHPSEMDLKEVAAMEAIAVVVPQITSLLISNRSGTSTWTTSTQQLPALVLIEDLVADDWEIVDDDQTADC